MKRILKQITDILNQNDIYHTVERTGNTPDTHASTDVYTVCLFEESVKKRRGKNKQSETETELVAFPVLQIKHTPVLGNVAVFLNDVHVYDFNNFKYNYNVPGLRKDKNVLENEKTLNHILDVCVKKSNQIHLKQLYGIKSMLREQKRG